MNFTGYKVGFWPYGPGLDKAGDRRRFVFYAKEKNIPFEIASLEKEYDVVYLNMGCNISDWLQYKKKYPRVKLVFEIIDSYFLQKQGLYTRVRGVIRFLTGKESKLYLNYQAALIKMITAADAVVCSTSIQKEFIVAFNKNVHISLDYFLDDISNHKTDFSSGKKLKLVWEGQAYTVHNLLKIKDVFKRLSGKIELHIITDPEIIYPFKIFNKKTAAILSQLQCEQYFYVWKKESFSRLISEMDLAIIPIDGMDELHWNKPENKLLLFWQIGIPVLTSKTPAYTNVMCKADLPWLCSDTEDWVKKIEFYINMKDSERAMYMTKANDYIKNNHTKEIILRKWDQIFSSVLEPRPEQQLQSLDSK